MNGSWEVKKEALQGYKKNTQLLQQRALECLPASKGYALFQERN